MESVGNDLRGKFVLECSESADRFEKPIQRVKILNFTAEATKKKIISGNTVQEIRVQRNLFGRMLGISMDYTTNAPRVDIIFDQYFLPSIKDYERTLRCKVNDLDFKITVPIQVRPVDFNKEMKNIKFKKAFVTFLIDHWTT
ncbi:hypothetical protein KQX54_012704 [Cotesia glomerata]|uniref:Uncharacterized protein n=1 Tax=Cotesia glomerata TaxID=32391 RepID=A0AAV7HV86_COTGL|nr:hypothetical protein KQX54_012704 [Cotesia glomerata]